MTTITLEVPEELATQLDLAKLPGMLWELVARQPCAADNLNTAGEIAPPLYRELTDFLARRPTREQIIGFKITPTAQARLEDLLERNHEETLDPAQRADLDTYLQLSEWLSILKARARSGQAVLG